MSRITTLFSTILLLAPAGARAQETRLSRKEIPSAVLAAFEKAYPKATIKHAMKETKNGHTTIEIESLDGTTGRDLQYMADGMVMEIEETIPTSEIPAPVMAAVTKKNPKGKIVKAEKVTRGAVVTYDIEIRNGKRKVSLDLDASGKLLGND